MRDALVRLGGFADPPLEPIVPAASQYHYRNKLEYSFTQTDDGPALGFHRAGTLGRGASDRRLPAHDRHRQCGPRRGRRPGRARRSWSPTTRRLTAAICATSSCARDATPASSSCSSSPGQGRKFEEGYFVEVLRRFPEVRSIHWAVNDTPAEVTNLPSSCCGGRRRSRRRSSACASAFARTRSCRRTPRWPRRCTALAREFAALTGSETVYDLYCGTGTIGLALASQALTVWGVEISEESVACAIENAELNGITNVAFFAGNVSLALEELRERAGAPDVVVVDPPRAGLAGKALRRLGRLGAQRIVYVSCNPTTLASDAEAPARRLRLRAAPLPSGRHVPAYAAYRDRQPARARGASWRCASGARPD